MKKNNEEPKDTKRKGRKKTESSVKGIGLFDHIKQVRCIQDPDYFKNLTDVDTKSFNHFMILKALSMNPALLGYISDLFKYFDKIPYSSTIPHERVYNQFVQSFRHDIT